MLIALLLKSIHLMLQTATWKHFSQPMPAISHLVAFGFNPENSENNLNFLER